MTHPTPSLATISDKIFDIFAQGATPADALGLSDDQLEAIYGLGHNLYAEGRFPQAIQAFEWLCRHAPLEARYLKALAAARQMNGVHTAALSAWSLAAVLDTDDPEPSFHAAECLLVTGDKVRARAALDAALMQASDIAKDHPLIARINTLRKTHRLDATDTDGTDDTDDTDKEIQNEN